MDSIKVVAEKEFAAMQSVFSALEPLKEDSRKRVLEHIAALLGNSAVQDVRSSSLVGDEKNGVQPILSEGSASEREFATLAHLHDSTNPVSEKDRVLVTAYWLQVCEGAENFPSFSVNKALKDLGHGVSNITGAFDALMRPKPALVLQLKKAGKSRQARKTYRVTEAGIAAVKAMIDG